MTRNVNRALGEGTHPQDRGSEKALLGRGTQDDMCGVSGARACARAPSDSAHGQQELDRSRRGHRPDLAAVGREAFI